jgi:hypothetical protein
MKKIIKLTESDLIKYIKQTINEQDSEYYEIPAQEYLSLLKASGYNAKGLTRLKKFGGKPLKVIGNLNLRAEPIKDLGKLYVDGSVYLTNSKIETIDGLTVTDKVEFYGTPYQTKLDRIKRQKEIDDAQERRENDEWNLNNPNIDSEGEMANAVFVFALDRGELVGLDDNERQRANDIQSEIKRLENEQENLSTEDDDWDEKYDEITNKIDEIQDEWDEIMSGKVDIYDLKPIYGNYDMSGFESIEEGKEYNVGTVDDADSSLRDYAVSLLDDVGYQGFNRHFVERHIDGDEVADSFEDSIRDDIYENPEGWDIRRLPSKQQYEEIWLLDMEKWVYKNFKIRYPIKYPSREGKNKVFDFMDDEDNSFQMRYEGNKWVLYKEGVMVQPEQLYDDEDTEEQKQEREERISEIEYERETILEEPDGDLDEDSVEDAVEDRKYDISNDPVRWLNDYGIDDYSPFINRRDFLDDVVDDLEYGRLGGYDDNYDDIEINGTRYIVVRTN